MLRELWTVFSSLRTAITSFCSQLFRRPRGEQHIPALPVEVCELIIDFVNISFVGFSSASDKARRDILLACALTCRAWRVRSQIHLYNSLILDAKTQLQACLNSLQDNPSLGPYVRSLTLRGNRTGDQFPSGVEHWTSLVAFALRALPNLDELVLKWCDWRCLHPSFFVMTSDMRSITRLILAQVELRSAKELVLLFFAFPCITFTRVMDVHCAVVHPHSSVKRTKATIPLDFIEISGIRSDESVGTLLRALTYTASGRSLKTLKLTANTKSAQLELNGFLSVCESLETLDLTLEMGILNPDPEEHLDLKHCVRLQHVRVRFHEIPSTNSCFLSQSLSTVASPILSHVRIALLDTHRTTDVLKNIDWDALDTVLCTPKFSKLRQVTMWISVLTLGKSEPLQEGFVEEKMPELAKRGILVPELRLE